MTAPFTKLRGVDAPDLDAALDGFTTDDWDRLERGYLDVIALDIADALNELGISEDRPDSVDVFWHLYQRSTARTPEV